MQSCKPGKSLRLWVTLETRVVENYVQWASEVCYFSIRPINAHTRSFAIIRQRRRTNGTQKRRLILR